MSKSLIFGIVSVLAGILAWRLGRIWRAYRGKRVVTCPENQHPAGVSLSAWHAVLTGIGQEPRLRLTECSRWPNGAANVREGSVSSPNGVGQRGSAGCGQQCISQIRE